MFTVSNPEIALATCAQGLMGTCSAHTTRSAGPGEETLTAGAIPTMQSLGIAFGAATAGLLANVAGLSSGITLATLTAVTDWIYGFALVPASCTFLAALRLVWLNRVKPARL